MAPSSGVGLAIEVQAWRRRFLLRDQFDRVIATLPGSVRGECAALCIHLVDNQRVQLVEAGKFLHARVGDLSALEVDRFEML
jgi:hypothetical protein